MRVAPFRHVRQRRRLTPDGPGLAMTPSRAGDADFRRRWATLTVLTLTWLGPLAVDAYTPALPQLAIDFDAPRAIVQLSLTGLLLGFAVGQLVAGPYTDRVGRRKPLLVALPVYLGAALLCGVAWDIWVLILARFTQGLAGAVSLVVARAIARDIFDGLKLARFYSQMMTTLAVAPMVGPIFAAFLMKELSWRAIFIAIAIYSLFCLFLVVYRLDETHAGRARPPTRHWLSVLGFRGLTDKRRVLVLALLQATVSGAMMSYLAGASFVFQEDFGLTPVGYSVAFAVSMFGLVLGNQLYAGLAGRISPRTLLVVGLGGMGLAGAGFITAGVLDLSLEFFMSMVLLMLASFGCVSPNVLYLAMQAEPENSGTVAGILGVAQAVAGSAAAPLVVSATSVQDSLAANVLACAAAGAVIVAVNYSVLSDARMER